MAEFLVILIIVAGLVLPYLLYKYTGGGSDDGQGGDGGGVGRGPVDNGY